MNIIVTFGLFRWLAAIRQASFRLRYAYRTLYIGVFFLMLLFVGCSSDDAPPKKDGLPEVVLLRRVAETRDYHNRITALYTYDAEGRLLKTEARDHVSIPGTVRSYTREFAYDKGRVSTMTLHYLSAPYESQFDHQITYHYDAGGRLTGETTRMLNSAATWFIAYEYDMEGRITRWETPSKGDPKLNARYDGHGNVEAIWWIDTSPGDIACAAENDVPGTIRENNYTYDSHRKPCFGIDELFLLDPLPYFGSPAIAARNLSACNMIHGGGYSWLYTYDEAGFPVTIETRWNGIETEEPMVVRLEYIEIKLPANL